MRTRIWLQLLLWYCWCPKFTTSLHFPGFQRDDKKQKETSETSSNSHPHHHSDLDQHNRKKDSQMSLNKVLSTTGRCTCGKVKFAIQTLEPSPPPLRLVCYCSDCRGYYETLDRLALESGSPPSAILDVSFYDLPSV